MRSLFVIMVLLFFYSVAYSQNIYNTSGDRIGFVKGDNFYNSSGNRIGFVNGDLYYNGSGSRMGQIKDKNIYDRSGNRIGYTDKLTNKQLILFLFFYLE